MKRWLFGPSSDKRSSSSKEGQTQSTEAGAEAGAGVEAGSTIEVQESQLSTDLIESSSVECEEESVGQKKDKRKGHGRKKASDYVGASVVQLVNSGLNAGDDCPDQCCSGRLYDTNSPTVFIQLVGQPIVGATRYEQEVLRCSRGQERYTASLPEEVKPVKYLESADAAIVLAKHSAGLPFYRMAELQSEFGVPVSESVQFERCERVADALLPVYLHLKRQAAQGEVIYADDTRVKILSLMKENHSLGADDRKGLQETCRLNGVSGFDYMVHLLENERELRRMPESFLPWNYGEGLEFSVAA